MINLRETLGVAVNSGSLSLDEEVERAVDRVAAMGFTEELGSLLWRLKYGGQRHYHELTADRRSLSAFNRIALRLEHWLRRRDQRWPAKRRGELFPRFVRLVLVAWLHDKCAICHGRGMLGIERATQKSVRTRCPQCAGRGSVQRTTPAGYQIETICRRCCGNRTISVQRDIEQEKPRPCPACNGLGMAIVTPTMWAALMEMSTEEWLRNWEKALERLDNYLVAVDRRTNARVKAQLGRD